MLWLEDIQGFALFMLAGAILLAVSELYDHARRNW